MKSKVVLFIAGLFSFVLSSCLNTDVTVIEVANDCEISSLTLESDSVDGLEDVKFTIDQLAGEIFNLDSLDYGTEVEKVLCTITTASSYVVDAIEVYPTAYEDSSYYLDSYSDSIDFSAPVKFVVYSYDGITTKTYTAWVNIHQLEPDSMVWEYHTYPMVRLSFTEQKVVSFPYEGTESFLLYVKPVNTNLGYRVYHTPVSEPDEWERLSLTGLPSEGLLLTQITEYEDVLYMPTSDGTLYSSTDGMTWSVVENTPCVRYVLGDVEEGIRQSSALATIVEEDGDLVFYSMNESMEWTEGDMVTDDFPLTGFGNLHYESMYYEYLMLVGGRTGNDELLNTTWATMDGTSWGLMDSGEVSFSEREGAATAYYDDQLYLIGGIDASDEGLKDVYRSFDCGVTWFLIDSMVVLPSDYVGRGYSSIVVDDLNYINLFGGKTSTSSNELNQHWRGRLNSLIPKEDE